MNRRERRAAERAGRRMPSPPKESSPPPEPTPPQESIAEAAVAKPGLVLRMFAKVALSPWVLDRVRHADVERLLAGVAVQAGRPEVAKALLDRSAQTRK